MEYFYLSLLIFKGKHNKVVATQPLDAEFYVGLRLILYFYKN